MDNIIYWIWITNLSGIKRNTIEALLDYFGGIEEIYKASPTEIAKAPGVSVHQSKILGIKNLEKAKRIIEDCKKCNARIVTYDDNAYPDLLRNIDNPPSVLYIRGEELMWDRLFTIAVVGTRVASPYGIKATNHISKQLATSGVTIVSGMAEGIDTVAAVSALSVGAKTIAVLGNGIDYAYPKMNTELMEKIIENGAVISEYPPGARPEKHHFPERNRIISGLSRGVLVTEAPRKSGALITAACAYNNGRDVFSVPGDIFSAHQKGSNNLIRGGAKPVEDALDILDEYPEFVKKLTPVKVGELIKMDNTEKILISDERYKDLSEDEKKVIESLLEANLTADELIEKTGLGIDKLNPMLPLLEMLGFIRKMPNNAYRLEM